MGESVITMRAARAYRDAGIRYGLYRAMFIGSVILMVFGIIPFGIGLFERIDWLVNITCLLEGIPMAVMIQSNVMMEFPHCPEISKEDIQAMRALGITDSVICKAFDASILSLHRENESEEGPNA
jgi:hypothetical protein